MLRLFVRQTPSKSSSCTVEGLGMRARIAGTMLINSFTVDVSKLYSFPLSMHGEGENRRFGRGEDAFTDRL